MHDDPLSGETQPEGPVPHRVLDTMNRRWASVVYFGAALVAAGMILVTGVGAMWLTTVVPLLGIGFYHAISGRHIEVADMEAIRLASDAAPFEVGHASATLGFTGLTAKPVWQVLVFESGPTPDHQALITVDGLSGQVTGSYAEAVEPV